MTVFSRSWLLFLGRPISTLLIERNSIFSSIFGLNLLTKTTVINFIISWTNIFCFWRLILLLTLFYCKFNTAFHVCYILLPFPGELIGICLIYNINCFTFSWAWSNRFLIDSGKFDFFSYGVFFGWKIRSVVILSRPWEIGLIKNRKRFTFLPSYSK